MQEDAIEHVNCPLVPLKSARPYFSRFALRPPFFNQSTVLCSLLTLLPNIYYIIDDECDWRQWKIAVLTLLKS